MSRGSFMHKHGWLSAVALGMMAWLGACAPPSQDKEQEHSSASSREEGRTRVLVAVDEIVTPFRNYQVTILTRLLRTRAGVDVTVANAGGDPLKQAAQLQRAVTDGAKVLLAFPLLSDQVMEALGSAKRNAVQVMVFGEEVPESACHAAILADEREMGRLAGEFAAAALIRKAADEGLAEVAGRVVQLRGDEEGAVSARLAAGFEAGLKPQGGVVLVHDAPGAWTEEGGAARMKEALRLQKHFDVVFAHNDAMALGAAGIAREAGVRDLLLIIGMDGTQGEQGGLKMVLEEKLEATIYRPPLIDVGWRQLLRWLEDPSRPMPPRTRVQPMVVTLEEASRYVGKGLPPPVLRR